MKSRFVYIVSSLFIFVPIASAQVVTSVPTFPTIEDSVVVIFNAKEGDGGLAGFTGDVYTHTGVITDKSTSATDWKYVIGNWGDDSVQPKLNNIGEDLWELPIGDIREFYGVPETEKVLQLALVFRSPGPDGPTGRDVGGADVFLDLFEAGLTVVISQPFVQVTFDDPLRSPAFVNPDETVEIVATAAAIGTELVTLTLSVDDAEVSQGQDDSVTFNFDATVFGAGAHTVKVVGIDTAGVADSSEIVMMVNPDVQNMARPAEIIDGVNFIDNSTVTLSLFAPFKEFIYVIGDFNDWQVDSSFFMNRHEVREDSMHFWLTIPNLDPGTEYAFQYWVDGEIRVADPYVEKVLDVFNDPFIPFSVYPNLKPYPAGKTSDLVGSFIINEDEYAWQVTDFQRPEKQDLVIYELLIRDFIANHDYQTLIDTLDYLENLGVNGVELMPVNEFDGNSSWGYNPALYFAPDKYYGTQNNLKRFIDECHARGIAVIFDMVLNHATGQSPLVRLYNEGNFGKPTAENPWFNVDSPNPFIQFFNDFDHESASTKAFIDRVNSFWLTEYKFDGFRFDFTKGFTNMPGEGGAFDAARIAILKRMADKIWEVDSTAYVILEHFGGNSEEIQLANHGMMLWGNMNVAYSQSAMGWLEDSQRPSSLFLGYYKNRGFTEPNLITYMESHDEPWLMYKNLQFGRSSGDYNVQDLATALNRIKLAAAFFLTVPGPKMMWQFGELGYDQFLAESGSERTDPKPILWQYFQDADRNKLYRTFAALLKLRNENEVFRSTDTEVEMRVSQGEYDRRIKLSHSSMNVTIIGNFNVVPLDVTPNFQSTGMWYDYFSGDSLSVNNPNEAIALQPGDFHIYTDQRVEPPDPDLVSSVDDKPQPAPRTFALHQNYPNPFNPETTIRFDVPQNSLVKLEIFNVIGQRIRRLLKKQMTAGEHSVTWDGKSDAGFEAASGLFILRMTAQGSRQNFVKILKMVKLK